MIRLLIVEDHPAIADGLAELIAGWPDMMVIGAATDLTGASELIRAAAPDIVLTDIRLSGSSDGFTLLSRHTPGPAFIMFSAYSYPSYEARALELGARGFVAKMSSSDELAAAIRRVAEGGTAFPTSVLRAARTALRPPSARELDVLRVVAEGYTNREIARKLSMSVKTIESQLRRCFDRYDVGSRTALVRLAERQGWLDPER